MTDISSKGVSRRTLMRNAALSVPVIGVALAAPNAVAAPPHPEQCNDPNGKVDNCAVNLPEEFTSASFSTTSLANGTNYSILFSTNIPSGQRVPPSANGYEIRSVSVAGTKRDGAAFSVEPETGEGGPRAFDIATASSLGFVLDDIWDPNHLVRSFDYTYDVVFRNGETEVQTCTYVTKVTLDNNGQTSGGVDSVTFSMPKLTACAG